MRWIIEQDRQWFGMHKALAHTHTQIYKSTMNGVQMSMLTNGRILYANPCLFIAQRKKRFGKEMLMPPTLRCNENKMRKTANRIMRIQIFLTYKTIYIYKWYKGLEINIIPTKKQSQNTDADVLHTYTHTPIQNGRENCEIGKALLISYGKWNRIEFHFR